MKRRRETKMRSRSKADEKKVPQEMIAEIHGSVNPEYMIHFHFFGIY
jgi:hypothetical protein